MLAVLPQGGRKCTDEVDGGVGEVRGINDCYGVG